MSFKNFYHNNANYYIENYSMGEFLFGYELEAIYDENQHEVIASAVNDAYNLNIPLDIEDAFENYRKIWGSDCTIRGKGGFHNLEFRSPPLAATPANLQKTIKLLTFLFSHGMEINSSCGFHVHISFPNLDPMETCWALLQMCYDRSYQDFLVFHGIEFSNDDYASPFQMEKFDSILHSAKETSDDETLLSRIADRLYGDNSDKYDIFGQHSQGTIEWRGPRGFANKSHIVVDFFANLLPQFIRTISRELVKPQLIYNRGMNKLSKKVFIAYFSDYENRHSSLMMDHIKERRISNKKRTFDDSMTPGDIEYITSQYKWINKGSFKDAKFNDDSMLQGTWTGGVFRGYMYGAAFDSRTAEWAKEAVWSRGWVIDADGEDHRTDVLPDYIKVVD